MLVPTSQMLLELAVLLERQAKLISHRVLTKLLFGAAELLGLAADNLLLLLISE